MLFNKKNLLLLSLIPSTLFFTGCPDDTDADGDGYTSEEDCDDNNADVYPGAYEANDGIDNDCNGIIDDLLITSVSAGGDPFSGSHSLAINNEGSLLTWGDNNYGQLGDGTNSSHFEPRMIKGVPAVKAVSAGILYSMALTKEGNVYSFGDNSYGQLGDSTYESSNKPVQTPLTSIVSISAAGDNNGAHSLALDKAGYVWTWGANYCGQLGDGSTSGSPTPTKLENISEVSVISGGGQHSLAVKSDGSLWAWGNNYYGQLGDKTYTDRYKPTFVPGISSVVDVDAGWNFSVALTADGSVYSWGSNHYNALGQGSTDWSYTVSTPTIVKTISGVSKISANYGSTMALDSDSNVWEWGYLLNGQGNGYVSGTMAEYPFSTGLSGIATISRGDAHNLVIDEEGNVFGWGANYYGQLGVTPSETGFSSAFEIPGI